MARPARAPTPRESRRRGLRSLPERLAQQIWQRPPTPLARLLQPLSWLYTLLAALHRQWWLRVRGIRHAPVPVVVVGNLVVGGAGKTPVVIATVQALRAAGWRPGVISRGHGRTTGEVHEVSAESDAAAVGDEPLLIRRRTGASVAVGRRRIAAARALCAAHPELDVLVSDDGLQHHELARAAELVVFDARGAGNGLRLPAGPLRSALPEHLPAGSWVLYNAEHPSTALPGHLLAARAERVWPLTDWWRGDGASPGQPLTALRRRPLLALAGIGAPEKFFALLEEAGLQIQRCPQPDHARYDTLPWPAGAAEVITTEKDAVKLRPGQVGATLVWVLPLDLELPAEVVRPLLARLRAAPTP